MAGTLPLTIGRDPAADVVLDDPKVSSHHARLVVGTTGPQVVDLDSANGVWRDDARVTEAVLREGDALRVGDTLLSVLVLGPEASRVLAIREVATGVAERRVVRIPCVLGPSPRASVAWPSLTNDIAVVARGDGVDAFASDGTAHHLGDGESVRVGGHQIAFHARWERVSEATDLTFRTDGTPVRREQAAPGDASFPPPWFDADVVPIASVFESGLPVEERRFLALGGGIGSFTWVDALRIHGVPATDVRVVGFETSPYARYARLCRHSQIPLHERLRSNSESCPDNLWGFPGYGLREAARHAARAHLGEALGVLWQLVGEPDRADTYTPRAGDVFASIDREADRIGWSSMLHQGRIRRIRKTDDGRFAVAVSSRGPDGRSARRFFVAPVVHLALGYPGVRFLSDLRAYRERTRDFVHVVNAYEDHDHVYARLAERGGTVVLRGRGIVASRVLQRLYEVRRASGQAIHVLHLMRTPNTQGQRAGHTRRPVENHWEFQPFNWPEACWGGDLAADLWEAPRDQRTALLDQWGGTTTAARRDWRAIVSSGLAQGWYRIAFGRVEAVEERAEGVTLTVQEGDAPMSYDVDHIIDATGLVSDLAADPILDDLARTYDLERNARGGLEVTRAFEVPGLRHRNARAFAAGVTTLGGGYAPVDSFLGLQYAAAASMAGLAPAVRPLGPTRSLGQWWRWTTGRAP